MTDDDVLMFWGKTRPHGDPRHKPLLHHLLDVAAVALQWQRANPTALAREAALLAGRPEHVVKTAAFLVAMHDVGKVSRGFQAKVPDLWPQRVLGQRGQEPDRGHWRNTAILLRADGMAGDLKELFPPLEQDDLAPIIAAIAGHHGKPPDGHYEVNAGSDKAVRDPELGAACVGVARAMFGRVRELIEPDPLPSLTRHQHVTQWSWRLSGLTTLADWVGYPTARSLRSSRSRYRCLTTGSVCSREPTRPSTARGCARIGRQHAQSSIPSRRGRCSSVRQKSH